MSLLAVEEIQFVRIQAEELGPGLSAPGQTGNFHVVRQSPHRDVPLLIAAGVEPQSDAIERQSLAAGRPTVPRLDLT